MKKVILISIDAVRPDGLKKCGNDYVKQLEKECKYNYASSSVMPSYTFTCHYSMAHSISTDVHGIVTHVDPPWEYKVKGIFEKIAEAGGKTAMFYSWDAMNNIRSIDTVKYSFYMDHSAEDLVDNALTDAALELIPKYKPDFVYLYLADTDIKGGHAHGWMSDEYLRRLSIAIDNVKRVIDKFGDEYTVILMTDHGGHDLRHGTDMPEDMVIPLFLRGDEFDPGETNEETSLLDIAPTIAQIMGIEPEKDWQGRLLCDN